VRRILSSPAYNPVESPDSTLIVYSGSTVGIAAPMLAMGPAGQTVDWPAIRVLAKGERYRFTPDGKTLIYMQGSLTRQDFWALDLITRKTRQLSRFEYAAAMRSFDITPDGKRIVFDRLRQNSDIVLIDLAN
jgi:hypothetical protein